MDDRHVAEYFVVAGLPENPQPLAEFSSQGANLKPSHSRAPITDIGVFNRTIGETLPDDYECIFETPTGLSANLNSGVLRSHEIFLCLRRGWDKPPLFDIGVLLEGRERLLPDSQVVEVTVGNQRANINPNGISMYITYRRATAETACNELVVSDMCIIMANKGEVAPHSYCTIERNLNKGTMVGSDVYLCYKKSVNRTNYIAYKSDILDHYPVTPRASFPVPGDLALFCLPMGATLEAWPPEAPKPDPVFSTFVLTVTKNGPEAADGVDKVYGAAVTFYERYCHKKLTEEQFKGLKLDDHFGRRNLVHTNKSVCILSMWPFFDTFEKFLRYIFKLTHSSGLRVPIERYIWHMLESVPFPTSRRPRILIQLDAHNGISLVQPEDSPIPLSGASFRKLVMNLHPEGCLQVLLYALTEQKMLLHSLRPHVLTAVAEAISMIIFPFHWQCPYIPLCPLGLSDILDAPIPFLIGLDSRFFDLYDPPSDVICIDLDTAAVSVPEDKKYLNVKMLPKKASRQLKQSLEALCGVIKNVDSDIMYHRQHSNNIFDQTTEADFKMIRKEQELETSIQETFLKFTASILKGYSHYLLPIVSVNAPDAMSLFDVDTYIKTRDKSYLKFYEMLVGTQMFSKFIEERSFVSDKNASLVFFDDCIEKISDDDSTARLLEVERVSSDHTFFLPPPEPPLACPSEGYTYKNFPKLNPELFPMKSALSEIPSQVKALSGLPGSPLARRSKHEIRSAQKLASKYYQTPMMWAKCLLSSTFSVWFAHLPSFIGVYPAKSRVLDLSFTVLQRMQKMALSHHDEVCYRVMMQLCGAYSKPVLAVKTLCEMKNAGITPNAITYAYYNRAVLESKWSQSGLLWSKLRNVVRGCTAFRKSGLDRNKRRKSSVSLDEVDKLSTDIDSSSHISVDSTCSDTHTPHFKTDTLGSDPGYCSVSEALEIPPVQPRVDETDSLSNLSSPTNQASSDSSPTSPSKSVTKRSPGVNRSLGQVVLHHPLLEEKPKGKKVHLDFKSADEFRRKLGSIVRFSAVGFSSGVELSLIETHPLLVSNAGLLMTSPLDSSTLDPSTPPRTRPTDLAQALTPTLDKYDKIQGTSYPTTYDSPEKSQESCAKDDTITKLLNFVYTNEDQIKEPNVARVASQESLTDSEGSSVSSFFNRNTPQRLSNLWKKSVGGADEKIRGIWKKGSKTKTPKSIKSSKPPLPKKLPEPPPKLNVSEVVLEDTDKDGHKKVIAGDPLGALTTESEDSNMKRSSSRISLNSVGSDGEPKYIFNNPLWTLDPPFENDRYLQYEDETEDLEESSSWSSFMIPLTGSSLGLASSVASQGIKQASKHIGTLRTNYIDPAVPEWASPSNFNYRRSISSMRSAVTTFSKKYNELKESLSTAPPRTNDEEFEEDMIDGFWTTPEDLSNVMYIYNDKKTPKSRKEIIPTLPKEVWGVKGPYCLGMWITSCSKCKSCKKVLFDEEIMAGWTPNDNNLNTKCWHCNQVTLPLLTVNIYNMGHLAKPDMSSPKGDESSPKTKDDPTIYIPLKAEKMDPLTVPYLSPLVLRKELETLLGNEGEDSLINPSLPNNHPILFWNMIWYFSRLKLPSHLPGLLLSSTLLNSKTMHDTWTGADWRNIFVKCLWDNVAYHQELGAPLYVQWRDSYCPSTLVKALTPHRANVPKDVLQSFLTLLHYNKVSRCLELMVQELKKRPAELKYNHYPLYRDLLFFAYTTIPCNSLNIVAFEQEFRREFDKIYHTNRKLVLASDGAPSVAAVFCKKYFHDLTL